MHVLGKEEETLGLIDQVMKMWFDLSVRISLALSFSLSRVLVLDVFV